MNDVTRILTAIERGDSHAAEQLLPVVYDELRKLATQRMGQEGVGHTLQATELVHEAYLRLVGKHAGREAKWDGRGHFFAAAAEAMRRNRRKRPADTIRRGERNDCPLCRRRHLVSPECPGKRSAGG